MFKFLHGQRFVAQAVHLHGIENNVMPQVGQVETCHYLFKTKVQWA